MSGPDELHRLSGPASFNFKTSTPRRHSPAQDSRRLAGRRRTGNGEASVFGEDGGRREAVFEAGVPAVQVFLPRHVDIGPGRGTDADDPGRAEAFGDEVRLETDLEAAAAERSVAGRLRDVEDGASGGHL